MNQVLLEAHGLLFRRHDRTILDGIDLTVKRNHITTLIGPNGAGKTTLVRLLLGLTPPDQGSVTRAPQLRIGYMPQKLHLEASLPLTVKRFLELGNVDNHCIIDSVKRVGMEHVLHSPMQSLSGGETQRILLARALLRSPQLLVLDEPVQGVDVTGQAALYQLIADIRRETECGVLMISHDLHLVMSATDTVICLNQHICCHGHPESVSAHPAYLELFGHTQPAGVAVYTHHHDHSHDEHGHVICDGSHTSHQSAQPDA